MSLWPNSSDDIPLRLREQESKFFSCHPRALLILPASVTVLSHHTQCLSFPLCWAPHDSLISNHSWSLGILPFPLPPSILLFSIKSHFSFKSQPDYQLVRSFHLESVTIRAVLPPHFVDSTGILNYSVGWWFIGTGIDSMYLSSSLESLRSGLRSFSSLCL